MDWDQADPGKLLDKAMDRLDLRFTAGFDPHAFRPQAARRAWGWKAAAAAAVLLAVGTVSQSLWAPGTHSHPNLASGARPSVVGTTPAARGLPFWTNAASAPWHVAAAALGHATILTARRPHRPMMTVEYAAGRPLWTRRGRGATQLITPAVGPALTGYWVPGSTTSGLDSVAAAGSYTYETQHGQWAILGAPGVADTWLPEPDPSAVSSWIQALPAAPATALLLTLDPSGHQALYRRTQVTGAWHAEPLPGSPVTELVAAGGRFWALAGGRLVVSPDGRSWTALYSPPAGFSVTTFAIDPVGNGEITLAMAPNHGVGLGPVLLSLDDGAHWKTLPAWWPTKSGPTSLVLDGQGDVTALFGKPGPVTIQRWQAATNRWTILPLPGTADVSRPGILGALSQGDVLYADPAGRLWVWTLPRDRWHRIPSPAGVAGIPNLVMGIGTQQVLVSYPHSWSIFVSRAP